MVQRRSRAGFAKESLDSRPIGNVCASQKLEGDPAAQH
jgi:hypothetical protein